MIMGSTPDKADSKKKVANKNVSYHIILFNDLLIVAKSKKPYYKPKFQLKIENTTLVNHDGMV